MKRIQRLRSSPAVPTSSMADIAFLLIIFFMLTAVINTSKGLEFAFPSEDPTELDVQPEEAIHIKILQVGQFQVDKSPMSLQQLGGYIRSKMSANPEKPIIIQTLPDVPYYAMIEVFDLLKLLEVKNVSIPTKSEIERWRAFGIFE